ncbi:PAK4-inhibitor INKA2 isoform X1 [Epinephelus lanceolatus]|uniref:PAK4-inhibitor INKA2 isoform X1 n=2 Tax=Epinephelus lanceolatus TaxID=310571 RepID=UPI001446F472|nr:PAK4-inhibitor INKA2 isoform X1 [Epinephelus lanceolatus]
MEQQLSKAECKNMDACLRRLKQELLCMKEAGDGLHAQMNSMMGALQELKLLQVQTALENLDISGRPINRGLPHPAPPEATAASTSGKDCSFSQTMPEEPRPSPMPSPRPSLESRNTFSRDDRSLSRNRSSLGTSSSSASSLESESEGSERSGRSMRSENDLESIPKRWSGYSAPQVDFYGPMVGNPPPEPYPQPQAPRRAQPVDLPGILYSLSKEGPSLDSDYSQDSTDDASDWTSSLMSRSRNRQPLVLGDNVFADLVGNWLDLPEVEREEGEEEERRKSREERIADGGADRPDTPAHPLRLSRSQEICRKFSLTTNIFKKFLRSVRPDRDKLLKERPGWMAPELQEGDLFKRPKKVAPKSSKGSFYLPFWANGQQGKGRPCPHLTDAEGNHQHHRHHFPQVHQQPFAGIYLDRRQPETGLEKMQPLFDYNTAVWV